MTAPQVVNVRLQRRWTSFPRTSSLCRSTSRSTGHLRSSATPARHGAGSAFVSTQSNFQSIPPSEVPPQSSPCVPLALLMPRPQVHMSCTIVHLNSMGGTRFNPPTAASLCAVCGGSKPRLMPSDVPSRPPIQTHPQALRGTWRRFFARTSPASGRTGRMSPSASQACAADPLSSQHRPSRPEVLALRHHPRAFCRCLRAPRLSLCLLLRSASASAPPSAPTPTCRSRRSFRSRRRSRFRSSPTSATAACSSSSTRNASSTRRARALVLFAQRCAALIALHGERKPSEAVSGSDCEIADTPTFSSHA